MNNYERDKVRNALKVMEISSDSANVTRAIMLASNPQRITQADEENGLGGKTIKTISTLLKKKRCC